MQKKRPGILPYVANVFLPGSAFFFIGQWKLALVWLMGIIFITVVSPIGSLAYVASFVHFYMVSKGNASANIPLIQQRGSWIAGGLFLLSMVAANMNPDFKAIESQYEVENTQPVANLEPPVEQPSSEPAAELHTLKDAETTTVSDKSTATRESTVGMSEAPPEEVTPPEPTVAEQLLELGTAPYDSDPTSESFEDDRYYYEWDRPDLGKQVSAVWRSADDWWIKISAPRINAANLGPLESITADVGRYTDGPLEGNYVIQSSVIHLWSAKYYEETRPELERQAEQARIEAEAVLAEPEPTPEPIVQEQEAVQPLYFRNCSEARAAGYSNMGVNHPSYSSKLDRDGDGIACER